MLIQFSLNFQEKGLIKKLEEDLDAYTLFVPSNEYARTVNVTVVSTGPEVVKLFYAQLN